MKNIISLLIFCGLFGWGELASAQNCSCSAFINPVSNCCGEIIISLNGACTGVISQVQIYTDLNPPFTGNIQSLTSNYPGVTTSVNAAGNIGTISISGTFTVNTNISLGEVCFSDVNNNVVTPILTFADAGNNTVCEEFIEYFANCPTPGDFKKIVGADEAEKPERIYATGNAVYVIGSRQINGQEFATFGKFDITDGSPICEMQLDDPSLFRDFAYNPVKDEFICVGQTIIPGSGAMDNQSIVVSIDANCNIVNQKTYDHNGRETFTRVIVHPNPEDPMHPVYVLGFHNPNGFPTGTFDETILYNIDGDLNYNWSRDYPEIGGIELEAGRGLLGLSDGDVIFVGNGSISNEGVLVKVDGLTGNFNNGIYHNGQIDWYDALEGPAGNIILSGVEASSNKALLVVVDPGAFNIQAGVIFDNVSTFEDIWIDQYNNLYAVGRETGNSPNRNILHKVAYLPAIPTFSPLWAKYLDDGETDYDKPRVYVSPDYDHIFYTDARLNHPGGFGDFDLLISVTDLEYTCDCAVPFTQNSLGYSVNDNIFQCNAPILSEPPLEPPFGSINFTDACNAFCQNLPMCDFTDSTDCYDIYLSGTASGGMPGYLYEWDINCDGSYELSGQNVIYTVPAFGNYQICLRITDAAGDTCFTQKTIPVFDLVPPVINCPSDITLSMDPGDCIATYDPLISASDDCDPSLTYICQLSGATTGNIPGVNQFPKGVTTVNCFVEDDAGNLSSCTFDITVDDTELPVITCPSNIVVNIPACDGGVNVTLPDPTVSDNCPNVTFTCSQQSGDYFTCGTTTVTCTATDFCGNVSTCNYNVIVDCECGELIGTSAACNPSDQHTQDFTITLNSLTGISNPSTSCTATVASTSSAVTLSNISTSWSGTQVTISGTAMIDPTQCPYPNNLPLLATLTCACPQAPTSTCDFPVAIPVECCRKVSIDDDNICRTGPTVNVPLIGCNDLCDVQQVRWFVAEGGFPAASWGDPFAVYNSCQDLLIDPQFHTADICVYAEVLLGPGDGSCAPILYSDTAKIILCDPVGCNIAGGLDTCYTGNPITPNPLTVSTIPANPNCPYTVQWYFNGNAIPGETNLTYQPPALSIPVGSQACWVDFNYSVVVSSECGDQTCSTNIRLYNDDAPVGSLIMDLTEPLPFCPGEDATLRYTPECSGEPARWDWSISTDGLNYTPMPFAGNQNPLWNTNRLYQDTWYLVTKQNGTCPVDTTGYYIPVVDPISITSFTASHAPICDPTAVDMTVDFTPTYHAWSTCDYTITFYQNEQIIHTTTAQGGPVNYLYTPASTSGIAGNYYAVVSSNCCDQSVRSTVHIVDPPCEVFALGPCFRCNTEMVTLDGVLVNPIAGAVCTNQWYNENGAIPGATGSSLQVDPSWAGPFIFEVTCVINGVTCVKTDTFDLKQCGRNDFIIATNDLSFDPFEIKVFPNPTLGNLTVTFLQEVSPEMQLEVLDLQGRLLISEAIAIGESHKTLTLSQYSSGAYLVRIMREGHPVWLEKILKIDSK